LNNYKNDRGKLNTDLEILSDRLVRYFSDLISSTSMDSSSTSSSNPTHLLSRIGSVVMAGPAHYCTLWGHFHHVDKTMAVTSSLLDAQNPPFEHGLLRTPEEENVSDSDWPSADSGLSAWPDTSLRGLLFSILATRKKL
jgi:hypothetical protein